MRSLRSKETTDRMKYSPSLILGACLKLSVGVESGDARRQPVKGGTVSRVSQSVTISRADWRCLRRVRHSLSVKSSTASGWWTGHEPKRLKNRTAKSLSQTKPRDL